MSVTNNSRRPKPNVLIAGTPGTGKTSLCQLIAKELADFQVIDVSDFCQKHGCIDSHDDQMDTDIVDEDLMNQKLSPILSSGGYLIDYHSPDLFDKELIDVVYILRTNNTLLYDRLKHRSYTEEKITANIECEIFETIVEEAVDWFGTDLCHQLTNETDDHLKDNCRTVCQWIQNYQKPE